MVSWVRKFLSTIYVTAVIKGSQCFVLAKAVKGGKVINKFEAVFDCNSHGVDIKFNEYLKKKESEFHSLYLAILLNSPKQWALPTVKKQDFARFGIDYDAVHKVSVENSWSIMVAKGEIGNFDNFLNKIDADLIYSPFSILYESILRNIAKDKVALYIYNIEDSMSMMVFKDKDMKFATYFDTRKNSNIPSLGKELTKEETIEIDNIIEKEEERQNELGDIEDISSMLNNSKKESFEDFQISDIDKKLEDSVRDMEAETLLLKNIRSAISEFYKNPIYSGEFIESIVIFDGLGLDKSFLSMIETEFLVDSNIISADVQHDMNNIMIRELY